MRQPPKEFVEELQRYDAELRVAWDNRVQLWMIQRRSPKHPGGVVTLFHVCDAKGKYLPLDNRVKDRLFEMDSWRFLGANHSKARLDLFEEEYLTKHNREVEMAASRRYFHQTEELADRLAFEARRNFRLDSLRVTGHKEEIKEAERRVEEAQGERH